MRLSCVLVSRSAGTTLLSSWAEIVVPIRFDQLFEQFHVAPDLDAAFGVRHPARTLPGADLRNARDDVDALADGRLDGLEAVMAGE